MAYFKPYIDEAGMHIPTYYDVVEKLCNDARRIFGQGLYLGADAQDYQWIATVAEAIDDANQAALMAYVNRGPATAIGTGLDVVVGINGLERKINTYSTVEVSVAGTTGARILNGSVRDDGGHVWDLPPEVVIGEDGAATATATCREPGVIYAAEGAVNIINTPTLGWVSVTNEREASVGSVAERDSELRARQAISVALPSQGILDGMRGAIAGIADVSRHEVYENDTKDQDANGLPPNSICAVVEGGEDEAIARAIYLKKAPGCYTHGTTAVEVPDADGRPNVIRFLRPSYADVEVAVQIKRLPGYTEAVPGAIRASIIDYFGTLGIGDRMVNSMLWWAAQRNVENPRNPGFSVVSITSCKHGGTPGTADIDLAFDEVARVNANDIAVNVAV